MIKAPSGTPTTTQGTNTNKMVPALGYKQAKLIVNDGGHARFSHADQCETGPKLVFDQAPDY